MTKVQPKMHKKEEAGLLKLLGKPTSYEKGNTVLEDLLVL